MAVFFGIQVFEQHLTSIYGLATFVFCCYPQWRPHHGTGYSKDSWIVSTRLTATVEQETSAVNCERHPPTDLSIKSSSTAQILFSKCNPLLQLTALHKLNLFPRLNPQQRTTSHFHHFHHNDLITLLKETRRRAKNGRKGWWNQRWWQDAFDFFFDFQKWIPSWSNL